MSNTLKVAALAVLAVAASTVYADPATTTGGIKVKTEDGRFEANVNGRIQFDYYMFSEDESARVGTTPFGTGVAATGANRGGAAFRRAYLTLTGKAYGWDYKFENDFTAAGAGTSFREMWIGTTVGPGKLIIGQHKPFRGMEELTSSNELTLIERPNTTATGIYAGRQFLTGLFYKGNTDTFGYGVHAASLQNSVASTEGHSFGGRAYYFPLSADGRTLHVGLGYSSDREDAGSLNAAPTFVYGGRRGATLTLGNAGAANANTFGTQNTLHAELAGSFGPFTAQAEYAMATLEDGFGPAASPSDIDVVAYYAQASYFITGESKVYKKDRGAFGSPKPINDFGAVELVARYESSENKESEAGQARGCALGGVLAPAPNFSTCEASQITLGANWYVNPNVRFMLNYYIAEADVGSGSDEPEAITLRAQMSF
ncbi:MAG: porin [Pseudomonadota bacterium]